MKRHRTDGVSLTVAILFLAAAGWWLVAQIIDLALPEVGWVVAAGLILLGAFGLFGALRSGRSAAPAAAAEPAPAAADPAPAAVPEPASGSTGPDVDDPLPAQTRD
ncbi:hypothetical protein O7632_06615 [Solwaraspora sp. WMMD406]|uniref:hypothetical protein n=1 Tax=Solwaraspora sp. WMMD406 TaxID=3016095 RepID=UPI0024172620|nr:hypothetical protein [Solwaraspora sp. WMMD406]MDG4763782.1 hypothetical protein [Solwaraspora sp. WMMD406]